MNSTFVGSDMRGLRSFNNWCLVVRVRVRCLVVNLRVTHNVLIRLFVVSCVAVNSL